MTTFLAAVQDGVFIAFGMDSDWFHKPSTFRCSVTGLDVDVFAIQTLRTMVSVTIAFNVCTTIFACKVFDRSSEFFHSVLRSWYRRWDSNPQAREGKGF